jgi:2',3'-cyclic-nucleotide 2'-phosphodiesterase (5'-nucleotidase family)
VLCENPADPDCYGGLPRIATSCKYAKTNDPATICLDAGDAFSGAFWPENDPDFSYLAAMNTFTDAYVVGNHDFDQGGPSCTVTALVLSCSRADSAARSGTSTLAEASGPAK